jgi:hypothetical protein
MKRFWILTAVVLAGGLVAFGAAALAQGGGGDQFRASLNGYNEVPSKSTRAQGSFEAQLGNRVINYTLTYANLETPASASHIHFAQSKVNGNVIAFLCGGGDKPACPVSEGTVTGTIDPADIIGPADQGIEAGRFGEAVRAMRAGATYVNVHSERFPGGEIRGQIEAH